MVGTNSKTRPKAPADSGVRERILSAALELLQTSGLRQFTQVNVATRAGVRQSHLTYYFPTRRDLIGGVSEHFADEITREACAAMSAYSGEDDDSVLARLAGAVTDSAHMRMFLGMIVEADADPEMRAFLVRATRTIEAALAGSLGGADAAERARVVLAAMWGLGLYRFVMRPASKAALFRPYLGWLEGAADRRRLSVASPSPRRR